VTSLLQAHELHGLLEAAAALGAAFVAPILTMIGARTTFPTRLPA
jgi:hypothetical protein